MNQNVKAKNTNGQKIGRNEMKVSETGYKKRMTYNILTMNTRLKFPRTKILKQKLNEGTEEKQDRSIGSKNEIK